MHRSLICLPMLLMLGCDFAASGSASASGSTAPMEGPAKPEYERSFDEFVDVPNQMTEQVKWAAEPIDGAIALADEIAKLRTELNIDGETFSSMMTVAFKDGTIEVGAVTEVQEAKAQIEATLAKVKQVGQDLQTIPGRVKTATKAIGKLAMSSPKLLMASTKELTGELAVAVGDSGAQIEADIATAKALPQTIKAEATEAKDKLAKLPDQAVQATKNLMAAMKGEPYEPMATTGDGAAEAEVVGDASAGATVAAAEPAATGDVSAGGSAAASGDAGAAPAPAGPATVAPPPVGKGPASKFAPGVVQSRISALQKIAEEAGKRGDWLSAADAYEEAFVLAPDNLMFAFQTGDSAFKAKDCPRSLTYLELFVKGADPSWLAPEIAIANRSLGELKTFECPPRTPEDEIALAETLATQAEYFGVEGDWGGAATNYALAYQLDPENHVYAFHVAVSSWNGRECGDASSYFGHFANVGDPRAHRVQLRETKKYQEEFSAGMCPTWAVGEKKTLARDLYAQAQALEAELDFKGAIGKYERAYYLLPTNHALAFRLGESAWNAQLCEQAGENYQVFLNNVDKSDARYTADVQTATQNLSSIQSLGCPNALWGTPPPASSSGGGDGGGAGDEKPPESGQGGGGSATSTVACSVNERGDSPVGALALGLLVLASLGRRRRDRDCP